MIYLISPYTHPSSQIRNSRYESARRATAKLMRLYPNEFVYSPIVYTHHLAEREGFRDMPHSFWMAFDAEAMMATSEAVVLCIEGWRESIGVRAEIGYFRAAGKRIRYMKAGHLKEEEPK